MFRKKENPKLIIEQEPTEICCKDETNYFQSRKWVAWAMCWAACVIAYVSSLFACWDRPEAGPHIAMITGVFIPSMCGLCGYYLKKQGDIDAIKEDNKHGRF